MQPCASFVVHTAVKTKSMKKARFMGLRITFSGFCIHRWIIHTTLGMEILWTT